jgi:HSP20 family protein
MSLQTILNNLIESNLNTSFSSQLGEFLQESTAIATMWKPNIDRMEDVDYIYLYIELPGVDRKSININFFNNILSIKGEKKFPDNIYGENIKRRQEIIYGDFERKILLSINITNSESVTIVNLENGVLSLKIDKRQQEKNNFSITL